MTNPIRTSLATCLLTTAASATFALQPLITDDTGTQGQSARQIEVAYVESQASQSGDTMRTGALPLVYTWGASDTLDVYLGIAPTQIRSSIPGMDSGGLGNTALGIKWRFVDGGESGTSLAIKPEVRLPVSASQEAAGLGTGMTSYGLTLILSQELMFGAIHLNLAKMRDQFLESEARPHATTLRASAAPVWNVNAQWKLALELGREFVSSGGDTVTNPFVQLGAIYSPSSDIDVAVGLLRSFDNAANQTTTTTATLGLTWHLR